MLCLCGFELYSRWVPLITPIIKITYRFNINFSQPEQRYRFKKRKLKSNLVRRVLSPWNEVGLT